MLNTAIVFVLFSSFSFHSGVELKQRKIVTLNVILYDKKQLEHTDARGHIHTHTSRSYVVFFIVLLPDIHNYLIYGRVHERAEPICNKANLTDLIAATGLVFFLKIGIKSLMLGPMWPGILMEDLKNNRALPLYYVKLCASFQSHRWIHAAVTVRKCSIWVKPCDLKMWQGTLKNNRAHLLSYFKLCASFHSNLSIQNLSYSPETPNLGQNRRFFGPVWPWNLMDDLEKQ